MLCKSSVHKFIQLSVHFNMPPIKNKPLNFLNSTPQYCGFGGGGLSADGVVQYNRPIRKEYWGGSTPRLNVFNIACWHRGSSLPQPASKLQFGLLVSVWVFMCVFGRPALSYTAMEEVCCRFARCRRRTSSLTLTLAQSKLVRLENQRFGFFSRAEGAPSTFVHLPRK